MKITLAKILTALTIMTLIIGFLSGLVTGGIWLGRMETRLESTERQVRRQWELYAKDHQLLTGESANDDATDPAAN